MKVSIHAENFAFYGIAIYMYYKDHTPPHFHAIYGEHEATVDIRTLSILEGALPRRAKSLILEWAPNIMKH